MGDIEAIVCGAAEQRVSGRNIQGTPTLQFIIIIIIIIIKTIIIVIVIIITIATWSIIIIITLSAG